MAEDSDDSWEDASSSDEVFYDEEWYLQDQRKLLITL